MKKISHTEEPYLTKFDILQSKMIKKLSIYIVIFIVFVATFVIYVSNLFKPVSVDDESVDFLITKGSSVSVIASNLEKAGLIKNAIVFKFYIQITSSQNKIQAGEYQLSPNFALIDIVDQLKKGPKEIWVTIPEGLRREEVALRFANALGKNDEFIDEFLSFSQGKEGYLFPDTYLFPKTATATQIVNKMLTTFDKRIQDITFEQVIMASMLERETFGESEKPLVAGILYKRLKNNWPLQVDATLQFAKDSLNCKDKVDCDYWKPIYSSDKEIKSPFNTYENLGLPPSPIASAGLSSLEAAINPEESEYWYYIHDGKGVIHYAKTLEDHNQNIRKYLW